MTKRFQVNLAGIIDLLSARLYSGSEVYLRELLQNGVDALTARAALVGQGDLGWGVRVRSLLVEGGRELHFEDDGRGAARGGDGALPVHDRREQQARRPRAHQRCQK